MQQALAAQLDSRLDEAVALYLAALAEQPDQADCLHMLGVIDYLRNDDAAALNRIERANVLTDWQVPMMRNNLALAVGRIFGQMPAFEAHAEQRALLNATRQAARLQSAALAPPLVSVIVPSYNHARFIEVALASVFAQTYPNLELIVIDDGSTDDSAPVIGRAMAACSLPHRIVLRGNLGAAATINEGVELAQGAYINVLNSDDAFEPERIALCVRHIHDAGADWGFADCTVIDEHGGLIPPTAPIANSVTVSVASLRSQHCISDAFFRANPAISTGNLFIAKALMMAVGGFSNLRYNHDWEFCLNASWRSEPVHIKEPLYRYRLHGRNTILESANAARAEANTMMLRALKRAEAKLPDNPLALSLGTDTRRFWSAALAHSAVFDVSADTLRDCLKWVRAKSILPPRSVPVSD